MKNLIFILAVVLVTSVSCDDSPKQINSKEYTTIEKMELPKDTIVVAASTKNAKIYQFNEEGLITKTYSIEGEDSIQITLGEFFIAILLAFIIGVTLGASFD